MPPKKILFLDKVLTKPLKEDRLRGVELFNLLFTRDLLAEQHEVTLIIHPSWSEVMNRDLPSVANLTLLKSSRIGGKNVGSLAPLWKIRNQRFDSLFLANVGDGILIPYHFIQKNQMVNKTTLLAHKVPGSYFVKSLRDDTTVVSVNRTISAPFELAKFPVTDVYYGILNAEQYYPPKTPRNDGKIKFGMLGDLDSDWKGSDTAIEAFLQLPSEIAQKSELHLAAFPQKNPKVDDPRIFIHKWIDRKEVGNYLRDLDIMLTLSREIRGSMMETFCQTMVQGMLCGLPQITTDLEIFSEKLNQGGGIVTNTKESLRAAMVELATNAESRIHHGQVARKIAQERYVWDSRYFTEKYL